MSPRLHKRLPRSRPSAAPAAICTAFFVTQSGGSSSSTGGWLIQEQVKFSLPAELVCKPEDSGTVIWSDEQLAAAVRTLLDWTVPHYQQHPPGSAVRAATETRSCVLGGLAEIIANGSEELDEALLDVARSPGLVFIADLGRFATWPLDLALDPWLRQHCRLQSRSQCFYEDSCSTWCADTVSFDEAFRAHQHVWSRLAAALYANLQPSKVSTFGGACVGTEGHTDVHVAVVGSHSGLSMAAADAFTAALTIRGQSPRLSYFGHWAWCQNVNNCEEPLALIWKDYQQDWAETDDGTNANKFEVMLGHMGAFLRSGDASAKTILSSDLVLCTRPFLFCWLLRELWPEVNSGRAVDGEVLRRDVPMLHYYSGPLLFDVPSNAKQQVLHAFRKTVLESNVDLVVSSSVLQSAWMLVMAGVAVPHVRPHAASLRNLYKPPAQVPAQLRAIVLRSTWTSTLMGEVFRSMLGKLLSMNGLTDNLMVQWLMGDSFLTYEEIASFHAAVFLPEQPDKLTFWEQYEMSMPMWLPSADFWTRIHAIGEFRYSVFANRWAAELPEGANAAKSCGLPEPLFFKATSISELPLDSPGAAAFWFQLTDYSLFPHLQLFRSAADLVETIISADLFAISDRMASFNEQTWRSSAAFYRAAYCMLDGSRATLGKGGRGLTPQFLAQPVGEAGWSKLCDSPT